MISFLFLEIKERLDGCVRCVTMEDNVIKIHELVFVYRRLKMREINKTVGISKDRASHILHEILGTRKLSA